MMRRVETGEAYSGEVPLDLFQGHTFREKKYLDKGAQIVLDGVRALSISPREEIRICTGYVLSKAREVLRERGFKVSQAKIAGETQMLAEKEFIKSLTQLGVGDDETVAAMRSFNGFLAWVKAELSTRERFVKTGWSSWPKLKSGENIDDPT